jgi:exosortase/archaeosortase family protein
VLNVAEACAGLRSLMTFITLGAAVAFLSNRTLWQKIIITLSAIPIAIFCNVMRVAGQGLLDYYVSHAWSEGFAHQFAGLVMLVPAFFLILLVAWCVDQLFVEEADEVPGVITVKRGVVAVPTLAAAAPTKASAPVVATTQANAATAAKPKVAAPVATKPVVQAPKPVVQSGKPVAPKPVAPKPAPAAPGFVVPLPGHGQCSRGAEAGEDAMSSANQDNTSIVRRVIAQPAFLAAVVVLAVAAVGLNFSVNYLKLHFKKLPVPMARSLAAIPTDLGDWQQVSLDEPLDPEIEHALGTNQYVFRDYMDARVVGRDTIEQVRRLNERIQNAADAQEIGKLKEDRARLVGQTRMKHPHGVINLAVTYYTGLVDTVAHVPDRCYVADGYEPKSWEDVKWNIDGGKPVEVRFINFEDGSGRSGDAQRGVLLPRERRVRVRARMRSACDCRTSSSGTGTTRRSK